MTQEFKVGDRVYYDCHEPYPDIEHHEMGTVVRERYERTIGVRFDRRPLTTRQIFPHRVKLVEGPW